MSLFYSAGLGAAAIPDKDSFEDQNLDEWTSTSEWETTTNRAYDGSVAVVKTVDDNAHRNMWWDAEVVAESDPKTASGWIYFDGSNSSVGITLVTGVGSGYVAYLDTGPRLNIFTVSEDSIGSSLGSTNNFSLSSGWYKISLTHDGGDGLSAKIEDDQTTELDSLSATDGSYDPDRFGVHAYSTGVELDLVEIK